MPVDALTAATTTTTTTMHWFAQIGHDLIENDERDNGEGKTRKGLYECELTIYYYFR